MLIHSNQCRGFSFVRLNISHREGTTSSTTQTKKHTYLRKQVSIPHRQGTTTAFTPFVTAIIPHPHHFCNVFLKKVGRSPFFKVRFLPILSHFLKIVIWALRPTDFFLTFLPQKITVHSVAQTIHLRGYCILLSPHLRVK